eukprot:g5696.t1
MFNPASSCCGGSRVGQGSPGKNRRLRVVLDIDETLIHAEVGRDIGRNGMSGETKTDKVNGIEVSIKTSDGTVHQVVVRKRPGVDGFLKKLAMEHDVYAFTASEEYYARPILKMLDPEKKIFKGCYFRTDCTQIKGKTFVKDLGKVEAPDMARTVLVDNNPMSFLCQPRNGIPILSWYGSAGDTALNILDNFLRRLQPLEDVRPFLNKTFGVEKALAKYQNPTVPASSP